jgi:hypothetical protein
LHRVLEDFFWGTQHPHLMNKTAITLTQAHSLLAHINHKLPFVSLMDSLEFLKGRNPLNRSLAVLLIEVPYLKTVKLLKPLLETLRIPTTFVLNTESIFSGQMPWMDEIIYRLGITKKKEIAFNFIDRSFSLHSANERIAAAHHLIEYLSHSNQDTLRARIKQIRDIFSEVAIHPISERICTIDQLEELTLNPLFSFACAGQYRMPLSDISVEDAKKEIVDAKSELSSLFSHSLISVFSYSFGSDKRRHKDITNMLMDNGFHAAIGRLNGVCRPGDNMFYLMRLPLAQGLKGFEQFELQGLSDAIDEFLLVTLAKERGL